MTACPHCNSAAFLQGVCASCGYGVTYGRPRRQNVRHRLQKAQHATAPTSRAAYAGLSHIDTQGQYRTILAALDTHLEGLTRRELAHVTGIGYEAVCGRVNEQLEVNILAELPTTRVNKDTGISAAVVVRATRLPEMTRRLAL